jgi:hypothetical protein
VLRAESGTPSKAVEKPSSARSVIPRSRRAMLACAGIMAATKDLVS